MGAEGAIRGDGRGDQFGLAAGTSVSPAQVANQRQVLTLESLRPSSKAPVL